MKTVWLLLFITVVILLYTAEVDGKNYNKNKYKKKDSAYQNKHNGNVKYNKNSHKHKDKKIKEYSKDLKYSSKNKYHGAEDSTFDNLKLERVDTNDVSYEKKGNYHHKKHGKKHVKQTTNAVEDKFSGTKDGSSKYKVHKSSKKNQKKYSENINFPKQDVVGSTNVHDKRAKDMEKSEGNRDKSKRVAKNERDLKSDSQLDTEKSTKQQDDDVPEAWDSVSDQTNQETLQFLSDRKDGASTDDEGVKKKEDKEKHKRKQKQEKKKKHGQVDTLSEDASREETQETLVSSEDDSVTRSEEKLVNSEGLSSEDESVVGEEQSSGVDEVDDTSCHGDADCPAGSCCEQGSCEVYMRSVGDKCSSACQCEPGLTCMFPSAHAGGGKKQKVPTRGVCVPPDILPAQNDDQ